ncbi:probable phospholipid-transporting ATPase IM isoform X4 [Lepeophtheirus salmonis]|nr:probable phospholipid-transporting ATPase IM isoform X4 [Lepeophtheirus salmonis]
MGFTSRFDRLQESQRDIIANDRAYNNRFNYSNNHIKTSKYSFLTFLPLNLFEQFQRLANFYFLCLLILQLIPVISSLTPVTTAVPLIGVLSLTAIKDAYDDIQRHQTDRQVNNRKSKVLRKGQLVTEKWHRVEVGDVIRMENNQFIAADILLLSSQNPNGLCYIETAELDGETNLKSRQCVETTSLLGDDVERLSKFNGHILCEPPNNNLSRFEGTLTWEGKKHPLDNEKLLLRGAILRNTPWCYGLVIFAGQDSKLMQNSGKTTFKRTSIDRLLNFIILGIVFFLLCMCLFCTIACGVWETLTGRQFTIYLPWASLIPKDEIGGATVISLLVFFSYAIVLNTVVPISLYVSVEVIRLALSFLISWDIEMYDNKSDTPAKARTTTLNEELGQIEYIFSDKTGTLTQNIMTFNKCSINGKAYGDFEENDVNISSISIIDLANYLGSKKCDFSSNPMSEPSFQFFDQSLLDDIKRGEENAEEFFRLLAVCHTVMPEINSDGNLEYQAQSPDENALVSAARNFGFVFTQRSPRSITILSNGISEVYELLCILDFNNVRKRMSVILKRNDKIRLYCKGADTVILQRLAGDQEDLKSKTQDHLDKFASEGLRTLVVGYKDLTESQFEDWKHAHHEAAISLEDREEKLDNVYDQIENNLKLLGATAIEDKLQDGVAQTISNLNLAGIKIWVLTGDKQETAINIGYSCQLLRDDLYEEPYIIDGQTFEAVQTQLLQIRNNIMSSMNGGVNGAEKQHEFIKDGNHRDSISMLTFSDSSFFSDDERNNVYYDKPRPHFPHDGNKSPISVVFNPEGSGGFALIVNGHSLVFALTPQLELLFLSVAEKCQAVICCRVTPLQKAQVVELVKKYKKAVTLAIGDGANDVSMIKTAHIGVGISGQEGMQAVLASDYSLAQFRFLERLLLVHGRWSYYRMCKFLRYFFYKNFAFTLCHFWYAFFCGFSAQTLLDPMFIAVYNLFYTSQPVLALGVFDQDVSDASSLKYPKLYTPGLNSTLFNKREFFKSALHGFLTSCILFFCSYGAYHNKITSEGLTLSDHMLFGSVVSTILVVVVTAQIALDTSYWTIFNHITIWGSLIFYFLLQYSYNYVLKGSYIGSLSMALEDETFWFTCLLTTSIILLPVVAWRFYRIDVHPTLTDKVRLLQRHAKAKPKETFRPFSGRRSRRSVRSGYAFAHQEGFGRLITSGKIMRPMASSTVVPKKGSHTKSSLNGYFSRNNNNSEHNNNFGLAAAAPGNNNNNNNNFLSPMMAYNNAGQQPSPRTINLNINGQIREVEIPNVVSKKASE